MLYSLTLPYPVSVNAMYRHTRRGVYLTDEARAYKEEAGLEARLSVGDPLEGEVTVAIDVYRPRKKGDLDNCLKLTIDSLNGIVWHDDEQIVEIHARRYQAVDEEDARVEITAFSKKKGHKSEN